VRMGYAPARASGTFLWSALLLVSKAVAVTHRGLGQGGGVRHGLPLRRDERRYLMWVHP